jgi:E3 ubiquitin-protein ligase MARCH6
MSRWWMITARAVNLGDMLTDWYHSRKQESAIVLRAWQVLDSVAQMVLGRYNNGETLARVPASDSVILLRAEERNGRGVFVRLDASGSPVTQDDKMMLLLQDRAARSKGRDPRKDYKMVWLPRYWRTRIHSVILSALVLSGTLVAMAAFGPLIVGRLTLDHAFGRPVHDGYSWVSHHSRSCWILSDVLVDRLLRPLGRLPPWRLCPKVHRHLSTCDPTSPI